MPVVADTRLLVTDQVITAVQATEIERRARGIMVQLAINAVLCGGIIAATLGLIAYLADPAAVAVTGLALLGAGIFTLLRIPEIYRMFGNAMALIGSGMLIGGGYVELTTNYADIAGLASLLLGIPITVIAARSLIYGGVTARFVAGSIMLMGATLHLAGLSLIVTNHAVTGPLVALSYFYAAGIIVLSGILTNVRMITALAIAPLAQMLDTSTSYFHAAYVFYSPESTLSILQMTMIIAFCLWVVWRSSDRIGRHFHILAIMAFIVANLCALVGSLWGDVVGSHIWGPEAQGYAAFDRNWQAYLAAVDAFKATALTISEDVYSVLWALALIAMTFWAAHKNQRGLFNTALTFLAIHGYTQAFESYYDEPLAYVIGGAVAIPLAWGMWRINQAWLARQ